MSEARQDPDVQQEIDSLQDYLADKRTAQQSFQAAADGEAVAIAHLEAELTDLRHETTG